MMVEGCLIKREGAPYLFMCNPEIKKAEQMVRGFAMFDKVKWTVDKTTVEFKE